MIQRFEGHFKGFDENELFFQTWTPEKIRGTLVITHGLAEHSECYHPLAKILSEDGWQVLAWDMRGHGRSEGKRGFAPDIASFVEDFGCFLREAKRLTAGGLEDLILFGHSLGGLVTTRYLETREQQYGALVLSSPAFGLSIPVPKFKEKLARIAVNWIPKLTMHNEIKYTDLTHDEAVLKSYQQDNLRHDKISPGVFLTMVSNFPLALQDVEALDKPVLMQLAGDDRLVSVVASRTLFDALPNKKSQLIVYPESFHEVYNDLEREKATADLKKFINPYLGA